MLGKLLKYEIPAMGRKLLPLYAAWAVTALFLGLATQSADSKTEFMVVISALLYTAVATAIFVMTIILIVQRYSNSLLGDEAYFNHVLPVSVSAHIGNKAISATVWIFITVLVAILTGILIAIGAIIVGAGDISIREMIHDLWNLDIEWPKHMVLYIFEALIIVVTSVVKTIMQIYAAVTIGHQAQNHTTLASIGAYIAILIFESIFARVFMPVLRFVDGKDFSMIFIAAFTATLALSAIYFFICKYLMENKLNLS